MTHAEQILRAVAAFVQRGKTVFTRDEIRREISVSREKWEKTITKALDIKGYLSSFFKIFFIFSKLNI